MHGKRLRRRRGAGLQACCGARWRPASHACSAAPPCGLPTLVRWRAPNCSSYSAHHPQIGQLLAIFRLLGTPDEAGWPGVTRLPHWCPLFPRFRAQGLAQVRGASAWRLHAVPRLIHRNSATGPRIRCTYAPAPLRLHICQRSRPGPCTHTPPHLPPRPQAVPQLDAAGLDLLARLLRYDPRQRITARQALAHPWFDDVRAAEDARARAALQAAQALQREMQLRPAPAVPAAGQAAAPAAGPAAGPAAAPAAGVGGVEGCGTAEAAPAATQGHLLTCEGEGRALVLGVSLLCHSWAHPRGFKSSHTRSAHCLFFPCPCAGATPPATRRRL